jgi:predicted nucleotidyltransferase
MNPNDPNIRLLEIVAEQLGDELCMELVFVGGAVAGLLITDPAMPPIRPTEDVDVVCHVQALSEYHRIEDRLRTRGFVQDLNQDAPVCRWRVADLRSVIVDVMPTLESILGFSNRWYPLALETAVPVQLASGRKIRLVSAPVFVATKLEAFAGRGKGDFLSSHDLEDLLAVVDGRVTLPDECRASAPELRGYLAGRFGELLKTAAFVESLPGHLPADMASQARLPDLMDTLKRISAL